MNFLFYLPLFSSFKENMLYYLIYDVEMLFMLLREKKEI